jgi:formylglycine-generating enzyme required for sulfatase activity
VLPTEAEWEYACRAGTETAYSCGNEITPKHARYFSESQEEGTVEVASYPANPWGLYDMHGNVWEWCYDGVRTYDAAERVDPVGESSPGAPRVVRGGSWFDSARYARSAYRDADHPGIQGINLGFRCALVREPSGRKPSERSEGPDNATEERSGRSD